MQFKIKLEKIKCKNNELRTVIASINKISDDTLFAFPSTLNDLQCHPELAHISIISKAEKSMMKHGQYRNIVVTLSEDLTELYLDNDGNFVYKDCCLEEIDPPSKAHIKQESFNDNQSLLLDRIRELETKIAKTEEDISKVEKLFILEKFSGKNQNSVEWIKRFELELKRHNIFSDDKVIQCLRFFLEGNAIDWYNNTKFTLTLDEKWVNWKENFLNTYTDKSWNSIRFALDFRYLKGSLVDYALKKESLLVEADSKLLVESRINLIVYGLPIYIQEKLDKSKISIIESLISELRRYDSTYYAKSKDSSQLFKNKKEIFSNSQNNLNKNLLVKKPCSICESLGFRNRFHPPTLCRNKIKHSSNVEVNLTEPDMCYSNESEQKN